MKKFLSILLTFVMLFSLTMPAMAAEVTGDTGKDVTATYSPTIAITGVTLSTADESMGVVTAENNVYTLTYPNGWQNGTVKVTVTGTNLGLIESGDYNYMVTLGDGGIALCNKLDGYDAETGTITFTMTVAPGKEYSVGYQNDEYTTTATGWTLKLVEAAPTYQVLCGSSNNGTVVADKTRASEGELVKLTVTPAEGYALYSLRYGGESGEMITITDNQFYMPAYDVAIEAQFRKAGTELNTIYFTGDGTDNAIARYFNSSEMSLGSCALNLTTGETDIYYAANIPEWTSYVRLVELTNTSNALTDILEIPTDGRNLYNVTTGEWSTYTPKATYDITVEAVEHGTVKVDKTPQAANETVTVTVSADRGYALESLIVNNGSIEVTKVEDGKYTFTMPAEAVTVKATFVEVPLAKITGVTLTVDGVTYTGAAGNEIVYITPASQITVTLLGENLQYAPKDSEPCVYGQIASFYAGNGTINADGTEATFVSSPSNWMYERDSALTIVNVNRDGGLEFDEKTGISVRYVSSVGTDLTTIYFNNENAWETITATFYSDSNFDGDNYKLGTAELSLVGGESVIYSTTGIPAYAAYVTFSNGTDTTEMAAIPMAAANTPQYNMDGTWTAFVPSPTPVTSAEIVWGSMSFTYDDTVDTATGKEKGWGVTNAADAQVTVKNTGETVFVAEAGYTSYEGYESITGSFTPVSSELAAGTEYTFTLELDGKPKKALSGDKIGKVTITITKVEESE